LTRRNDSFGLALPFETAFAALRNRRYAAELTGPFTLMTAL